MPPANHKTHARRRGNTITLTAAGPEPVVAILDARSIYEISTTQGGQLHLTDGKGETRIITMASQDVACDALYAVSSSLCRWGLWQRIGAGLAVAGTALAIMGIVTFVQVLIATAPVTTSQQQATAPVPLTLPDQAAAPPQSGLQGFGLEVD